MRKLSWKSILALLLAAFFVIGGIGNIFVSAENAANYQRWGYPDWFHYVTGILELAVAGLLIFKPTRLWGALLAVAVMIAAAVSVLSHGEYAHAIAPLVILVVAAAVAFRTYKERSTP